MSGCIFAIEAHIDNRKNLLSSNISSTCPQNMVNFGTLAAEIDSFDWRVWGHHSKFQRLSRRGFVTAATSLNGSQPNFARCLAVSWAGIDYLYIFGGCCPVTEFCQVQNSLCVLQVLHSPIFAALLHGTRAIGASHNFAALSTHGATYIQQAGDHHVGHWPTF